MKMKKLVALIGSGFFFFLIVSMYLVLEQFSQSKDEDIFNKVHNAEDSVNEISKGVAGVASQLKNSKDAIEQMEEKMREFQGDDKETSVYRKKQKVVYKKDEAMCSFSEKPTGNSADVKMLDVFDILPFDNPDGGAWKQGWNVQYPANAFDKEELLVFVVPHSHNDPGWIKTVDQYYRDQTRHILDNVMDALEKHPSRKFIWAETSYFSMWWEEADSRRKELAKKLLKANQLEIVTGGWVMNDEANPHYYAMVDQLLEGHQWMEHNVGVKPSTGWAIDPFGHSSTMAYLLKRMGFDAMLIQRVHYQVKKYLAREKKLEFMWRQNWDHGSSTDILCHMMPFYSYDVPHTCGPDPKVCCQFDFRRLPGGGISCPWMVPPTEIEDYNVKERSYTLLDQYRKKAQLYQTNVVLAPLGDDFRYEVPFETNQQYTNYEKIMEYVNNHPDLQAKIQFGTLRDYFEAVWKRRKVKAGERPPGFPVLGGDFFTYADRDDHYWSGYFTSRPFYKHLDRILESYHRAAEILFTLGSAHAREDAHSKFAAKKLYNHLSLARQDLGLFQHHDAVTGTARDHVVVDYGLRMERSIKNCQSVIAETAQFLLGRGQESSDLTFTVGEKQSTHDSLLTKEVIIVGAQPRRVVFYNSLTHERTQVVSLMVSEARIKVTDHTGAEVKCQTTLPWTREQKPINTRFELTFVVEVGPLGMATYVIQRSSNSNNIAKIGLLGTATVPTVNQNFKANLRESVDILIRNDHLEAKFDPAVGTLLEIRTLADLKSENMKITFHAYGTRAGMDKSGAYLFLPDGDAKEVGMHSPVIVVSEGPVFSEVISQIQYLTHRVRIYHVDVPEARALDIKNWVDIRNAYNTELIMRINSDVKNENGEFFTDLNGFQMQRRRTLKKLPLQANFYPLPALAFLQDHRQRLVIHAAQPNGVASLHQGALQVVLDRRMFQDDNRGLGQGITDNKITPSAFQVLLERRIAEPKETKHPSPTAYPSMLSLHLLVRLQHPVISLVATLKSPATKSASTFQGMAQPLPCDLHLLTLRTVQQGVAKEPTNDAALLAHRQAYDCNFLYTCPLKDMGNSISKLFSPLRVKSVVETSLSLMHDKQKLGNEQRLEVPPMEIKTYRVSFN